MLKNLHNILFCFVALNCTAFAALPRILLSVYESNGPVVPLRGTSSSATYTQQATILNATFDARSQKVTKQFKNTYELSNLKPNFDYKTDTFVTPPPGVAEIYGYLPIKAGITLRLSTLQHEGSLLTLTGTFSYKQILSWNWGRGTQAQPIFNEFSVPFDTILNTQESYIYYSVIPRTFKEAQDPPPTTVTEQSASNYMFLTIIIQHTF